FPETNNDYIKAAAADLKERGICEPVLEESDMATAGQKVADGIADGMVAGVDFSSRDVILACRDQIGVAGQTDPSEKKTFSSLFVADFPDGRRYIVSDGATCKNPTAEQLADIVILVHAAAVKLLDDTPRIAMLSFSTFGSGGKDPSMDKIAETIRLVRERNPEILIDGVFLFQKLHVFEEKSLIFHRFVKIFLVECDAVEGLVDRHPHSHPVAT
ncbi:MAG: hypothetical protein II662_07190, partial [Bacteroidales bacterium]|nr:hypothetical protein [Bacteroidales bacterium]